MKNRILFVALLLPVLVFADLYYWKDANGVMHVTSEPPPKDNTSVKTVESLPESAHHPKTGTRKKKQKKITIYSTDWCPACKAAKEWMGENGIKYRDVDIEKSEANHKAYKKYGTNKVPVIVVGKKVMQGFDSVKIQEWLNE